MLKLILITGFLGSGKTTCMQNIINCFKDEKIGVIVNEFGEEGIDGKLIKKDGLTMMELNNGSIFCQCIKSNFIDALCSFLDYDISYLFIEASGLADPSNIKVLLKTAEKITNKRYNYLCSICVVDAFYFLKQLNLFPALKRQIQYSNIIVINKSDLVSEANIAETENAIKNINKNAYIIKTSYCIFDIPEALKNISNLNIKSEESTNSVENRPLTGKITINNIPAPENLNNFIHEISQYCFRVKGFAKTSYGNYVISTVNDYIDVSNWEKDISESTIIFISKIGIKTINLITSCAAENDLNIKLKF